MQTPPDPRLAAEQQMDLLGRMCTFGANLPSPPVSMPPDPVAAAGLDLTIFLGLGVVGVWAAVDAYRERKGIHTSVEQTLQANSDASLTKAWIEIEDLRDLHAHNFAGIADAHYFLQGRSHGQGRRSFSSGQSSRMLSGAEFDGERLHLRIEHLRWYLDQARAILSVL
jgi:hypothetical protein